MFSIRSVMFQFGACLFIGMVTSSSLAQEVAGTEDKWQVVSNTKKVANMQVRGLKNPADVEFYTETLHLNKQGTREFHLGMFRDSKSGYIWWVLDVELPQTMIDDFASGISLIPDVGFVRFQIDGGTIFADVLNLKSKNYEEGRDSILAQLGPMARGETTSIQHKDVRVKLSDKIGRDFFFRPDDFTNPPQAIILSVNFVSGYFEIELQSGLAKEKAIIELNKDFEVLKTIRNGIQTYPKV